MTDDPLITPRTLKGFRDLLPAAAIPRDTLIATAIGVYQRYGYAPIETPALEYAEVLLGKGGAETDKQMYRFEDHGGRDVAMRFDLTVPLARFIAEHIGELGTPFKRYHVGTVWRGENTQRGRYREFVQCDFDTIGTESELADIETALVIDDLFTALGLERFTIRVNDRRVLNGVLRRIGLAERAGEVLRTLDKLPKVGPGRVAEELRSVTGASAAQVDAVMRLGSLQGTSTEMLTALEELVEADSLGEAAVAGLRELVAAAGEVGVPLGRLQIDPTVARGLDYYTGIVFETFLDDLPGIGSCCSGGRYDDLASLYTKQRLPGVGASLGVDRLLAAMAELGAVDGRSTVAPVLVTRFDEEGGRDGLVLASRIRREGIGAELYPDVRRLGAQLRYADRRGHRVTIVAGPQERAEETAQVKDMATGESVTVPRADLVAACRRIIEGSGN